MSRFDPTELELAERDAMVDATRAAAGLLPAEHPAVVRHVRATACTAVVGGPPVLFNRALAVGVEQAADDDLLDAIEHAYAALNVPFRIPVAPCAQPADLAARLLGRGYHQGPAWMKFARATDAPPEASTDLVVHPVGAEHAEAFGKIAVQCFGLPDWTQPLVAALPGRAGWSCFAAFDGNEPVATGALWTHDGRGWLGFAAALPAARGRGAQSALLAERIRAARDHGARVLSVETGVPEQGRPGFSYRNILKAGFVEQYRRENYDSPQ